MLKIRLQRIGKINKAYFRVVVTEHTTKPKGRYLELLGSYNPHTDKVVVNSERVKYWISNGAKLSETVNNLLVDGKLIEGKKVTAWKPKKKQKPEKPASTPDSAKLSLVVADDKKSSSEAKPVEASATVKKTGEVLKEDVKEDAPFESNEQKSLTDKSLVSGE